MSEQFSEQAAGPDAGVQQSLNELDALIGELKEKVASLREGEFDASALETRLR